MPDSIVQLEKRSSASALSALRLDDRLCYALYSASITVGRIYKPLLDELGITYPQFLTLSVLWEEDRQTVGALAHRLGLESSTLTPLIKRLAAADLVRRSRNPTDEREVFVELTAPGQAMRERCDCLGERLLAASGMALADLARLNDEIRGLRDTLNQTLAEATSTSHKSEQR